ncbi:MAG: imidazolonepropionase [Nitrospinae bacterium CG11_big_fil_rev_8_21_14_0_20_56_8]|nr:MAG: imidazolonepropionase [Nitrospinae bacterium CG11_big_fil_rev_8_21_14_0_20_56_8]
MNMKAKKICFKNIGQLVQVQDTDPPRLKVYRNCALVVSGGRVEKVFRDTGIRASDYARVVDLKGRAVIPGFIDPHTHMVYGGDRKAEMEMRAAGDDYLEILKNGGGILSTVNATRKASEEMLYRSARERMKRMIALGTTAFEIKSGYGLDLETEKKILRVGRRLAADLKVHVTLTYLGAHAVPEGVKKKDYFDFVLRYLPEFRELADGVDIFCERGAFTVADLKRLFLQAKLLGFQLRAHVEEFTLQGGCYEAARLGAISCDHLEHARPHDIRGMAVAGTVGVLLPGVTHFLGGSKLPLVHTLLDSGVPLALATDCNPGSCPTYNMQTILTLATAMYRLTPEQALVAATYGGARALDRHREMGGLRPGQRADFLLLKTSDYRDLFYYFGENFVDKTFLAGSAVSGRKEPVTD